MFKYFMPIVIFVGLCGCNTTESGNGSDGSSSTDITISITSDGDLVEFDVASSTTSRSAIVKVCYHNIRNAKAGSKSLREYHPNALE